MVVEFVDNLPNGTVIRMFSSGYEGIILDKTVSTLNMVKYIVEFRHGDSTLAGTEELAPADHPVHDLLQKWNDEGKAKGYDGLVIGMDTHGDWHHFFAGKGITYGHIQQQNKHVVFKYYWRLRD